MPDVASALIVVATFAVAHAILREAALSFLDLGVQTLPSCALMIAEGKSYVYVQP